MGDITWIRTYEGFLYLAVVLDLFSRPVIGWSMQPTLARDLVMQALLSAVWRRRPTGPVIVHSDQGSHYGSHDYVAFLEEHGLEPSMRRRGDCLDNAVAESFFSTLKKLRIRKKIYPTRDDARADIFDFRASTKREVESEVSRNVFRFLKGGSNPPFFFSSTPYPLSSCLSEAPDVAGISEGVKRSCHCFTKEMRPDLHSQCGSALDQAPVDLQEVGHLICMMYP